VIKRVLPPVMAITRKTGDVVDNQFGVVDQCQAAGGSVAEELVAETALDASDKFPYQK